MASRAACGQRPVLYHTRTSLRPSLAPRPRSTDGSSMTKARRERLARPAAAEAPAAATASSSSSTAEAAVPATSSTAPAWSTHSWEWRGHRVRYITAGCGPPVLLVHGFGASSQHYRRNIGVLAAAGYKVFALDLLGQGGSAKPLVDYTMEQWRDQIGDFHAEFVQQPAVLVGNSIGSLACLMVAADAPQAVRGLCLLNCAGGMNNKAIADDIRIKLAMPLFLLIDWLLQRPRVARYLFDRFRTPDNIRQVLQSVYGNPASVDEELVNDIIHAPSCDEGALEAFVSIITGPPGPRPDRLLLEGAVARELPLLVLWGDADPFTPADGPVGKFFQALPQDRPGTTFTFLPGVGHCPHDDFPELVHAELLPWLEGVHPPRA